LREGELAATNCNAFAGTLSGSNPPIALWRLSHLPELPLPSRITQFVQGKAQLYGIHSHASAVPAGFRKGARSSFHAAQEVVDKWGFPEPA
jgi:hypothetical protein